MTHLFKVAFYGAGVIYALFIDQRALIPFFIIVGAYFLIAALLPGAKPLSTRKKFMQATWTHPSEPNIQVRVPVRAEKVLKLLETLPKENRPSITHFCIKACGEVLSAQPFLNGTLSLGKVHFC